LGEQVHVAYSLLMDGWMFVNNQANIRALLLITCLLFESVQCFWLQVVL